MLRRTRADGIREKEVTQPSLTEEADDLANDLIESGQRAQRVERGAIGGMLPGRRC